MNASALEDTVEQLLREMGELRADMAKLVHFVTLRAAQPQSLPSVLTLREAAKELSVGPASSPG